MSKPWQCHCGASNTSPSCETCGSSGSVIQSPSAAETWHYDENGGACVPASVPHCCPNHACQFYDAAPARVGDPVTASDSIATTRAAFKRAVGRIGGPAPVRDSPDARRALLRDQAATLLRQEHGRPPVVESDP